MSENKKQPTAMRPNTLPEFKGGVRIIVETQNVIHVFDADEVWINRQPKAINGFDPNVEADFIKPDLEPFRLVITAEINKLKPGAIS
jgi:hypothetical protein